MSSTRADYAQRSPAPIHQNSAATALNDNVLNIKTWLTLATKRSTQITTAGTWWFWLLKLINSPRWKGQSERDTDHNDDRHIIFCAIRSLWSRHCRPWAGLQLDQHYPRHTGILCTRNNSKQRVKKLLEWTFPQVVSRPSAVLQSTGRWKKNCHLSRSKVRNPSNPLLSPPSHTIYPSKRRKK